jgi:hypothetical protein
MSSKLRHSREGARLSGGKLASFQFAQAFPDSFRISHYSDTEMKLTIYTPNSSLPLVGRELFGV